MFSSHRACCRIRRLQLSDPVDAFLQKQYSDTFPLTRYSLPYLSLSSHDASRNPDFACAFSMTHGQYDTEKPQPIHTRGHTFRAVSLSDIAVMLENTFRYTVNESDLSPNLRTQNIPSLLQPSTPSHVRMFIFSKDGRLSCFSLSDTSFQSLAKKHHIRA